MKHYDFDSHKLMYHCDRVGEYLIKKDCFPLYMEISPVGSCNHRCIFCAYDFIGHPYRRLHTGRLLRFIDECAHAGLRSILFAGEGEPLLHPDIVSMVTHAKKKGVDVGMFTNGHLLTRQIIKEILPALTFIRFSFNAGSPENYAAIHQVRPDIYTTVLKNIAMAVTLKKKEHLKADIGIQYVLLPENKDFLISAVKAIRKSGADYFVIKPFVHQSALQSYRPKRSFTFATVQRLLAAAEKLSNGHFRVIARRSAFQDYGKRKYQHCYGTSFISVLNSAGDIATCLPYWEQKKYVFGNINGQTFEEIWQSRKRRSIKKHLEKRLDVRKCPPNCRPNAINEFLWEITHPSVKHVNFI